MTTYYILQPTDEVITGAAFTQESVAEEIKEQFNERYVTQYEVVEKDKEDVTSSEIANASTIAALEGVY